MRELSEVEKVVDGYAVVVRGMVTGEERLVSVLEQSQRVRSTPEVVELLDYLDHCPSQQLLEALTRASDALDRQRAPERS